MAKFFLFLASLLFAAPALGGPSEWMVGHWYGEGEAFDSPVETTLVFSPALGGAFYEMRYEIASPNANMRFEGRAFYKPVEQEGAWQAVWFDNRGKVIPISAVEGERSFTADWVDEGTEHGRTLYRLLEGGRLEVTDSVRQADGSWQVFGTQILNRKP